MFSSWYRLLVFTCIINIKFVVGDCEKSYIVVCESLPDVEFNKTKKTWTELLIQPDKYDNLVPRYVLSRQQLTRDLTNLRWLIIVNQLTRINSNSFSYSKNLQHLMLFANHLRTINKSTFTYFKNLVKLSLENNAIEFMEASAFSHSTIATLDLSHNDLSVLVSALFKKCAIEKLIVKHNQLSNIETNCLPKTLKFLHLDHNRFTYVPEDLKNLDQLEELTISHNNVYHVSHMSLLESLKKLDFSFNNIASIGEEFDGLKRLKYLDLSSNALKRFSFTPTLVKNLGVQFSVLLAYNRLRSLNVGALNGTKVTITLSGNPWNYGCIQEIDRIIHEPDSTIARTTCDRQIYNRGLIPYCLIKNERAYSEACSEEEITDEEFDVFRKGLFKDDSCDLFGNIDVPVY